MKNESINKSAKTDRMRIKIRSVTVGSAALVILLSIFQQAAAQTNSYTSMLNTISNANRAFWTQQNGDNNNLYRMSHGNSYQAPATPRQYPITATNFRPIFQWMAPDLVANSQPGLTPEQKEGLKAFANQTLTKFEARYRKNNVAIAMTYLFSVSYMVNTGHLLSGTECDQWTTAFNNALAANVDFITMSPRDKQLEYEQAVVIGGMIAFLNEQENPAQQSAAREMARTTLRNLGFYAR